MCTKNATDFIVGESRQAFQDSLEVFLKIGRISCLFLRVQDTAKSDNGVSVK